MLYPNPCCRCGLCCLSETCPIGMRAYGINKTTLCPGLTFKEDKASCVLPVYLVKILKMDKKAVDIIMGFNTGCCIKARAYKNGVEYDFAGLSSELKIKIAQNVREQKHGD